MDNITMLVEYAAWLIRNSYKEAGLSGNMFDCDVFSILINPSNIGLNAIDLPDMIVGLDIFCDDSLSTEVLVRLIMKPEDCSNDSKKFIKAFYELQMLYDFNYNDTWKKECGLK